MRFCLSVSSFVLWAILVLVSACLPPRTVEAAPPPGIALPAGWPKVLSIPRLGIRAGVEPVAMTSAQDVEAPHRMDQVAWYSRGHKPGERGRAQIFGHLDSTCCPAIFYHLHDLRPGDTIQVTYRTGAPLTFRVRWQTTYARTGVPTDFMYGPTYDHGLILITCAGVFHRDGTGYDHRLMVYATLVS